jgi:hypothetical protein
MKYVDVLTPLELQAKHPDWDTSCRPVIANDGTRSLYVGIRLGRHLSGLDKITQRLLKLISKPQHKVVVMSGTSQMSVWLAWIEFCRQLETIDYDGV